MEREKIVHTIFLKALESVRPLTVVKGYLDKVRTYYSMKGFNSLLVIGFGKAAYQMAEAVEDVFEDELKTGGVVVTKYGHTGSGKSRLKKIKVCEAGHPIPDENGIEATEGIIKALREADEKTLVVCLVSGGGSALFVSPCDGIVLKEKQLVTDLLLKAGADIRELNSVRKHLSRVKGGRLAEIAYPAEMISLMISDVIGDRLDVIASGPTAPDSSTYQDALDVINKYALAEKTPAPVMELLKRGADGSIPDTPKKGDPVFQNVQNTIIGSNRIAIEAAKREAAFLGCKTEVLSTEIKGEASDVGIWLAGKAKDLRLNPLSGSERFHCLISGGETTVKVKGKGKGGRNTELALSFAMAVEGVEGITLLSAGTDGTDGPTDAAGAIVDGHTIAKAKDLGMNPREYLENNDSYNFFKKIDTLLITGPTGTNVMDVQIIVIERA